MNATPSKPEADTETSPTERLEVDSEVFVLDRVLAQLALTLEIVYVRRPLEGVLGDDELTTAQLRTLNLLAGVPDDQPGTPVGTLASGLRISYPAATKAVDRLAERGLAERHRDSHDARQIRVRLTERGREVVAHVRRERLQKLARALHDLGDANDQTRLLELLERFMRLSLLEPDDLSLVMRETHL
jgi:DNA-binding MarR family transcriptional regulator